MNFMQADSDDCNRKPPWLQIAVVVLPAVLPIVFERVGDAISGYYERKREREKKQQEQTVKSEDNGNNKHSDKL